FFFFFFFFFQAEDGIRDLYVTGVQTCALPISSLCWLTGSSAGYEIGGMAARRAARAAARAAARSECDLDRPGRPDRSRAGPAGRSEERRVGKEGRSRWAADD